jgi:hypothetical protein
MKTTLLILICLVQFSQAQLDQPDYNKENQFFRIYQNFNQSPVPDQQWNQIVKSSQVRVYEVLNQDTLWDISEVLFADPMFWPKIWSLNSNNILNPHEIKPGWRINFIAGTLFDAPNLAVEPGQDESGQGVNTQSYEEFLENELTGVEIPPSLPTRPVANIPPSLPQYFFRAPPASKVEVVKNEARELDKVPPLPLPVEIFENQPSVSGEIVEFEDEARVAVDNRDLYVKLNADLGPGIYTTVKKIERSKFGYVVVYGAEIEVTQRINDSENIYRAKTKKMINVAEINDQVIPGTIPVADVSETVLSREAPLVKIVGGYRSPTDSFYSAYSIVFLNGGISQGLRPGDSLKVYLDPKIRMSKTKVQKAFRSVGVLKVLRTQSNVSTAYILSSQSELRAGDLAGYLPEESEFGLGEDSNSDELTLE